MGEGLRDRSMLSQWAYQLIGATSQRSAFANEAKKEEKKKKLHCFCNKLFFFFPPSCYIPGHIWKKLSSSCFMLALGAIILGGHWCLFIDYLKGHDLIALIFCEDVNRWGLFLGFVWVFQSDRSATLNKRFPSARYERLHSRVTLVNWSNCTAEYFIASDTGIFFCVVCVCAFLFFIFAGGNWNVGSVNRCQSGWWADCIWWSCSDQMVSWHS